MSVYVGLDVSLNSISICVIDAAGDLVWRGKSLSEPASLLAALEPHGSERVQEDTFPGRQSALKWTSGSAVTDKSRGRFAGIVR